MQQIPYVYKHCPVPGGGYATGFLFHPREKGLLYLRTDIGGVYRFNYAAMTWVYLTAHATHLNTSQTSPISIAVDENHPRRLYVLCGERHKPRGELALSEDCGDHFTVKPVPFFVHGNLAGRGTGERLIVDRRDENTLWCASQTEGLWVTRDRGDTWQRVPGLPETHLTFIAQVQDTLLVGAAGVACRQEAWRSPALYAGDGESFRPLPVPPSRPVPGARLQGLTAQRCSMDDAYLYVTFSANGPRSQTDELGYSCDSGDAMDGHVVRYALTGGMPGPMEDITPCIASPAPGAGLSHYAPGGMLDFGFSGVSASRSTPGLLIASTICKGTGDSIFLSRDHGDTWQQILFDLQEGDIRFRTSYMRPEYNGGHSIIHWLSDLKLNPFDDDESWFNTGTGVFRSFSLTRDCRYYTDWSDGVEETVHLNVYAPPSGRVQVIDIIGDLGGFAFTDLDKPCRNSFEDAQGNRYITCINADFADRNPDRILASARGNWTGKTRGGLILSGDNAQTWRRLPMPYGLTAEIDQAAARIERPNTNPGWAAMSPDGRTLAWTLAQRVELPVAWAVCSQDGGETWEKIRVFTLDGAEKTDGGFKIFADRVSSDVFYGFGDHSDLYLSLDRARTFRQVPAPADFPRDVHFARIDCANGTEIRGEAGRRGHFLLALGAHGLWTLDFSSSGVSADRLSKPGDAVFRAGYGLGTPGGDFFTGPKAIYFNGVIGGTYGFYRTLDEGASCVRLNTDDQMYGQIISIDGDKRTFGRFYLATGCNGLIYGQMKEE